MAPELRHLRYFLALADQLNFTAAAARLYVTQQTLSRAIAGLERDIGQPLFRRSTRAVELTEAGRAMLEPARRAVQAADEAVAAAQGRSGDGAGRLRVDISSGGIRTGAEILRELASRDDAPAVHQVEVGVRAALTRIRAGALDAVLGLAPAELDGVAAEPVRREPVLVGVSSGHPWSSRRSVAVGELGGQQLLLPSADVAGEWRGFIDDICRQAGVTATAWRNVTHGSVAAAEEVRTGACVVPTNEWTEIPEGLVFLPLVDPVPYFPWSLMWRAGAGDEPPVSLLRRATAAAATRLGWSAG